MSKSVSPATIILVALVGAAVVWVKVGSAEAPPPAPMTDLDRAKSECETYVKSQLNDPASAEFPATLASYPAVKDAAGNFDVQLTYRAKNKFGGLIGTTTDCRINTAKNTIVIRQLK